MNGFYNHNNMLIIFVYLSSSYIEIINKCFCFHFTPVEITAEIIKFSTLPLAPNLWGTTILRRNNAAILVFF